MNNQVLRAATGLIAAILLVVASSSSGAVLHGRGELHAMGNGLAKFDMVGVLVVRGGGVLIVDDGVRIETEGRGRTTFLEDGRVLYEGYGHAIIASETRMQVTVAGARIRLHAKGKGRALLKGVGRIQTEDLDHEWADDPEVDFEPQL